MELSARSVAWFDVHHHIYGLLLPLPNHRARWGPLPRDEAPRTGAPVHHAGLRLQFPMFSVDEDLNPIVTSEPKLWITLLPVTVELNHEKRERYDVQKTVWSMKKVLYAKGDAAENPNPNEDDHLCVGILLETPSGNTGDLIRTRFGRRNANTSILTDALNYHSKINPLNIIIREVFVPIRPQPLKKTSTRNIYDIFPSSVELKFKLIVPASYHWSASWVDSIHTSGLCSEKSSTRIVHSRRRRDTHVWFNERQESTPDGRSCWSLECDVRDGIFFELWDVNSEGFVLTFVSLEQNHLIEFTSYENSAEFVDLLYQRRKRAIILDSPEEPCGVPGCGESIEFRPKSMHRIFVGAQDFMFFIRKSRQQVWVRVDSSYDKTHRYRLMTEIKIVMVGM